jgi:hypothetical protein
MPYTCPNIKRWTIKPSPNLFDCGLSELSQGAFFQWLLEWANHPKSQLGRIANRFILDVIRPKLSIPGKRSELIRLHTRREFCRADMVVVFEFRNSPKYCAVIENKIHAKLTGTDQVERNVENVLARAEEWPPLSGIEHQYYKGILLTLGFDYDFRSPEGYASINYRDILKWVRSLSAKDRLSSDILRDWTAWFEEMAMGFDRTVAAAHRTRSISSCGGSGSGTDNKERNSVWSGQVFQYALLKSIFGLDDLTSTRVIRKAQYTEVWFRPPYDERRNEFFKIGTSIGGSPWVQYWFNGEDVPFFYRLDRMSGIWSLSLRIHKPNKNAADFKRMGKVTKHLTKLLAAAKIKTLPLRNSQKFKESTLVLIDPCQSPGLSKLAKVHERFVKANFPLQAR